LTITTKPAGAVVVWRYSLQVIVCAACVLAILTWRTNGFKHYTYESIRRANVVKTPMVLSDWQLLGEHDEQLAFYSLKDKLLLVNFIYTRCPTICQSQGTRYQQLQQSIKSTDKVLLLSVSIDPAFDTSKRLQYYRKAHRGKADTWYLTRPVNTDQLRTIVKETGLRIIEDNIGGYAHSESIHVVRHGKIVSIEAWDSPKLEALIANAGST